MKIQILGAGPAGLYFAALMKQLDPRHEITIFERGPRHATWGFGVVFSDRALEFLRQDDEALYLSSADWMTRNMLGRIEIAWPVRDRAMRQRVIDECLVPYLHDHQDAWQLLPDGRYERDGSDGPSAQRALLRRFGG